MKIALFLETLDPGGAERAVIQLANIMSSRGHAVDLVVGSTNVCYISEISSGVRLVSFDTRYKFWMLVRLIHYLRVESPESIMSSLDDGNVLTLLAAILSLYRGTLVFSQRASLTDLSRGRRRLAEHIRSFFLDLTKARVDRFHTNSKAAAKEMSASPLCRGKSLTYIPNFLDIEKWLSLSRVPIDCELKSLVNSPYILSVGSIIRRKGHETTIMAFSRLRQYRDDLKLVILGDTYEPGEKKRLQKLLIDLKLEEFVFMPGYDPNPLRWMRHAEMVVSSSHNEGFPNIIAQAMALDCKIVATDCPGDTSWLLEDGRWGWLFPIGDVERLSTLMKEVLLADTPCLPSGGLSRFSSGSLSVAYENLLLPSSN